jgi:hypothetical protein
MKQTLSGKERRKYPRISRDVDIEVARLSYPLTSIQAEKALSKDIGGNGICLTKSKPYEPDTVVSLKINIVGWESFKRPFSKLVNLSSTDTLTAVGKVVWCKETAYGAGFEVGVRFIDIYEDDYKALMRYLKR